MDLFVNDILYTVIAGLITLITIVVPYYLYNKSAKNIKLEIKEPLKELSTAKSVQEIAASQMNILGDFYNSVLTQSQKSFYFALASAGLGLLFFMSAGGFLLVYNLQSLALITTLGGTLSGFVSGINFYIYNLNSAKWGNI